jgi:hypothetical protein
MELVDRYLHAVRGYLPRRDQDDIIRELGEDIRSQVDDRERELGRPMRDVEVEALLKQLGHPMVLASRYGPQRELIGPAVFPFYWLALKIALGVALLVQVVVAGVLLAGGREGREVVDLLVRFPTGGAISVFGWVTLVFGAGQFVLTRAGVFEGWQPRTLPQAPTRSPRASRFHAFFELIGHTAMLAWILTLPTYPALAMGPAAAILDFAPIWERYYVALVLLVLGWMTPPAFALLYPERRRARLTLRIVVHVGGLVLLGLLLDGGPWVLPKADTQDLRKLADIINTSIRIGIIFSGVITGFELVKDVWKLLRAPAPVDPAARRG